MIQGYKVTFLSFIFPLSRNRILKIQQNLFGFHSYFFSRDVVAVVDVDVVDFVDFSVVDVVVYVDFVVVET